MIKNPGSEVAFLSILWILAGSWVSYMAFADGKAAMGCIFAMLPVGCALMWLDIRPAKWLVVIYLAIAVIGAIFFTAKNGISTRVLLRGAFTAYCLFIFAKWNGNPKLKFDDEWPSEDQEEVPANGWQR